MTLILASRYTDPAGRLVHRYHAPSSTTPGKVYVVDNLVGTDVWSCGPLSGDRKDACPASTYKKTCRHIPNWREPPKSFTSKTAAKGGLANPGASIPATPDFSPVESILTLREKIEMLANESVTFRKYVIERKSGPIVVALLARFHGFRIAVPEDESMESYLMSLPQFSTIRTASLDVLKAKQAEDAEGWEDDGLRQERHGAYRKFYAEEGQGQQHIGGMA